MEFVVKQWVLG